MKSVKAVLFDLDGTLVDTEDLHLQAWRETVEKYGCSLPAGWEYQYIGNPDIDWARRCAQTFSSLPPVDQLLDERHRRYRELLSSSGHHCSFPGLKEELAALIHHGFRIGVGTNSPMENTRVALLESGIDEFFQVVVTFGMTPRGKPFPDIYLSGMKQLGVAPHECAVIEDSPAGIAAGKAAGAQVIGVATTHPIEKLHGADKLFSSTVDALRWLRDQAGRGKLERIRHESF